MLKRIVVSSIILFIILVSLTFIPLGSEDPNPQMDIYLISNEIHTDFVLPVRNEIMDWEKFFNPTDFKKRYEWVEMGWGDKEYYMKVPTWNEFTLGIALDSIFLPGPSVMHVGYLDHPKNYQGQRKVSISFATYRKLVEAIQKQFKLENGKPLVLKGKGYSESDNFYEAYGSFSVLKTCNVWTSEMLKKAGLKHPIWSPTKYGLEYIWRN